MKKAQKTKQLLYNRALGLFAAQGFDGTTMRDIAKEAEIALGAIYYHYPSKEAFIGSYYEQTHADHLAALGDFLEHERGLEARLHRVVTSKIEVAEPHKDLARALFRVAANPESPLSPWSDESRSLRLEALELFQQVVDGSQDKIHPDVRALLPEYLWLYQMGLILFWIYDRSPGSKRTFEFIDKTVPMIAMLNRLTRSTLASPIRKQILKLMTEFHPDLNKENDSKQNANEQNQL